MIGCVICSRKNVTYFGLYSKLTLLVLQCCHINPWLQKKIIITPLKGKIQIFIAAIISLHFIYSVYNLTTNLPLLNDVSVSRTARELLASFFAIAAILSTLLHPKFQKNMLENTQAIIDNGMDEYNLTIFKKDDENEVNKYLVWFSRIVQMNVISMVISLLCLLILGMITIDDVAIFLVHLIGSTCILIIFMEHMHVVCVYNSIVKNLNRTMADLVKTHNKTKKMRAVHRIYLSCFNQWDLLHQFYDPMVTFATFSAMFISISEVRWGLHTVFENHEFPFDQMYLPFLISTLIVANMFQMLKCDTISNYVSFKLILIIVITHFSFIKVHLHDNFFPVYYLCGILRV